ncbi:hypothetical protein F3Y22_tig00110017pilonHSYRG00065 [Hibiscus syriacus]|uniref:Uncharacterized protein n=1 Tax=Hibiscus syriacus TaxID=106335 RepID=A0A6A3BT99_HIBSY|nr:hypothetical protein F3Y22_tig00110017pilonHSYRG00065 [Hibiscus syriacus]
MEVVIPVMEFDFNSARSSPRSTAPSTPTGAGGGCFFSAPTSPTRLSEFYREFDRFSTMGGRQSSRRNISLAIPFDWEEKPGTPKSPRGARNEEVEEDDFAFDFCEALEKTSLSAEDLFDGGKIKPLKPPPGLQVDEYNQKSPLLSSPRSPQSPFSQGRKLIREAFSPRKKKDRDPFATAIQPVEIKQITTSASEDMRQIKTDSGSTRQAFSRNPKITRVQVRNPGKTLVRVDLGGKYRLRAALHSEQSSIREHEEEDFLAIQTRYFGKIRLRSLSSGF